MGNQVGKGANRMAIAAMSNVTHVEKREIINLQIKLKEIALREGKPTTVNRVQFTEALVAVGINQNDADILDKLFTMFDKTGDDQIEYKDFIVGIAPLISGTPADKIEFAFRLHDYDGSGLLKSGEMYNILSTMNRVASYFGDPVVTEDQIHFLVRDIYEMADQEGSSVQINFAEYIKVIADHPTLITFINGNGTFQYGMKF
eukprot:gene1088-2119_t